MGSRRIAIALVVAVLGAAPQASAAPSAAQRETARRLMDEGKERMRAGDTERAVEAYQKAHDLMHVPTTGMALARAQLATGRLVEARDVALEVVRMVRENGEPAVFEKARRDARALEANLKPRIPTVRIVVKGGPATRVTVDGTEVAPLLLGEPVAMNPGKHTIVARNADGTEKQADVQLAERDVKEVELALPVPHPAVIASEPASPRPSLAPAPSRDERTTPANVLLVGGFGLAVAGLAVGGVTGALTLSKAGEVKAQCENNICAPEARRDLDSASSLATISTIGFAVAGVGAVCGVVGLLLPRTTTETALQSRDGRAAVWVGPGSVGLRGSF
ncbi:MAG: hypothetical protein KF819_14800 [Labilithrix sp.]|nr:hypothetical protein [Labilithrix sp.]